MVGRACVASPHVTNKHPQGLLWRKADVEPSRATGAKDLRAALLSSQRFAGACKRRLRIQQPRKIARLGLVGGREAVGMMDRNCSHSEASLHRQFLFFGTES
jgi:hypothetical protein